MNLSINISQFNLIKFATTKTTGIQKTKTNENEDKIISINSQNR